MWKLACVVLAYTFGMPGQDPMALNTLHSAGFPLDRQPFELTCSNLMATCASQEMEHISVGCG